MEETVNKRHIQTQATNDKSLFGQSDKSLLGQSSTSVEELELSCDSISKNYLLSAERSHNHSAKIVHNLTDNSCIILDDSNTRENILEISPSILECWEARKHQNVSEMDSMLHSNSPNCQKSVKTHFLEQKTTQKSDFINVWTVRNDVDAPSRMPPAILGHVQDCWIELFN